MKQNRSRHLTVLIFALLGLSACSHGLLQSERSNTDQLTILSTTDFHSSLSRAEGLANQVKKLRDRYKNPILFLDAGDLFLGSLEGDLENGKAIVDLYNLLGLDAAAVGNHDLDYGPLPGGTDPQGQLFERAKEAQFSWLSANWIETRSKKVTYRNALNQPTVFPPHAIFEKGSLRVCVIGATTPITNTQTLPSHLSHSHFDPLLPVVQAESRYLRREKNCDLVILTIHAGMPWPTPSVYSINTPDYAEVPALLKGLELGSLDAVVAGHTHIRSQETIANTPVLQAGLNGETVGVLHLNRNKGTKSFQAQFEPFVDTQALDQNAEVIALLSPYRSQALRIKNDIVATIPVPLPYKKDEETALGNLVSDSFLAWGKKHGQAEIALLPAKHLRTRELHSGLLTYGHLYEIIPYNNHLVIAELTGKQLRRVLEIALGSSNGMGSISGLTVIRKHAGNPAGRGQGVIEKILDLNQRPISDRKTYRLITPDYLIQGGDQQDEVFLPLSQKKLHPTSIYSRDAWAAYMSEIRNFTPEAFFDPEHPRIKFVP